jgi:hypothetical protein
VCVTNAISRGRPVLVVIAIAPPSSAPARHKPAPMLVSSPKATRRRGTSAAQTVGPGCPDGRVVPEPAHPHRLLPVADARSEFSSSFPADGHSLGSAVVTSRQLSSDFWCPVCAPGGLQPGDALLVLWEEKLEGMCCRLRASKDHKVWHKCTIRYPQASLPVALELRFTAPRPARTPAAKPMQTGAYLTAIGCPATTSHCPR